MMERKMVTGQGYGLCIGGCDKLCPVATGLSLVILFFLSMSIEDRLLLWMVVKSEIYYPEHILAYGSWKARYSLVVDFGSFRTDWLEAEKGGGLSTTLRPGLKGVGLESLDGDLDLSTGVELVGLACAWGTSEACVLGYPTGLYWFANRLFYVMIRLGCGLAP
jgi:hypothetical protein